MAVNPIPAGHHTVTPYLIVRDAPRVIDFLQRAFDAEITHPRLKRPDGTIMHAEVKIGDSRVMIAEESQIQSSAIIALPLRRRRRQRVSSGDRGRRQDDHGADGHVLWATVRAA